MKKYEKCEKVPGGSVAEILTKFPQFLVKFAEKSLIFYGVKYKVERITCISLLPVMFYYIGMALGRFVSGLAANKLHSWKIIHISECILAVALLILLFSPITIIAAIGLFLIGFGNGPMFPNFNYLTPENFGEEKSVAIIGVQMAFASISSMSVPVICGLLSQFIGMWIFPIYLLLFFVLMVFETLRMHKINKID